MGQLKHVGKGRSRRDGPARGAHSPSSQHTGRSSCSYSSTVEKHLSTSRARLRQLARDLSPPGHLWSLVLVHSRGTSTIGKTRLVLCHEHRLFESDYRRQLMQRNALLAADVPGAVHCVTAAAEAEAQYAAASLREAQTDSMWSASRSRSRLESRSGCQALITLHLPVCSIDLKLNLVP